MVRSILAVLLGYVAMFAGVMLTTALAMVVLLGEISSDMTPTPAYLIANLSGGLLSAIVGGFVAAWIAARSPMGHAWVLTAIVAVLAVVMLLGSGGQAQGQQPAWYPYALLVVPVVGIPLGGKLRGAYEKR